MLNTNCMRNTNNVSVTLNRAVNGERCRSRTSFRVSPIGLPVFAFGAVSPTDALVTAITMAAPIPCADRALRLQAAEFRIGLDALRGDRYAATRSEAAANGEAQATR
jgi:hypothetical protein